MVKLTVDNQKIEMQLEGNDETILSELSSALVRALDALEEENGQELDTNVTYLVLNILKFRDERNRIKQLQEEIES